MVNSTINTGGSTLDDLNKLSLDELKQKRKEAASKGNTDEISRISSVIQQKNKQSTSSNIQDVDFLKSELEKAIDNDDEGKITTLTEQLKNAQEAQKNTPKKDHIQAIRNLLEKGNIGDTEKEQLKKLIAEYQRLLEEKKQYLGEKPKDAVLNNLYEKLMDHDEKTKGFGKEKIGKPHNSVLPFIPYLRFKSSNERKKLREAGIVTINTGEIEILGVKRWIIRGRMNRVATYFNKLSDTAEDTDKAMRYIFSMSKKRYGGRAGAGLNRFWRKFLESKDIMKNPEKLDIELKKKKKDFLDAITEGMEQPEEQEIMKSIKERLDFYIQNYRVLQAKKWLS